MFRYDAVTAKCRCLAGRLFTKDDYAALVSRGSFSEAVAYLKDTPAYSGVLDGVEPGKVHRARLEGLLEADVIDMYAKLYTFTSGAERKFLGHLLEEYEIGYLLDAIRATEYDDTMEFYRVPKFIIDHAKIDFVRIFRTDSKDEVLAALEGTEYHEILRPVLESGTTSFAGIEAEINRAYYTRLMTKYSAVFPPEERKRVREMISTKIDLMNISCIVRLRRFAALRAGNDRVKLDFTAVLPILIPAFGKLKEPDIAALCNDEIDIPETIDRFAGLYKKPAEMFTEHTSTGEYGSELLYSQAKKYSLSGPSFDVVLGVLSLKKFETDNIIYILEALRYGMPEEEIKNAVIA